MTELLYLESHEFVDPRVEPLIAMRSKLLGQHTVKAAYTGYAVAQAKRLGSQAEAGQKGFNSDLAKRTDRHLDDLLSDLSRRVLLSERGEWNRFSGRSIDDLPSANGGIKLKRHEFDLKQERHYARLGELASDFDLIGGCLLYTSPSPRD